MLESPYPSGIILRDPVRLPLDSPVQIESRPSYGEGGSFDEVTRVYLVRSNEIDSEEEAITLFPKGRRLGAMTMWVVKSSARCVARGLFQIEVTARGRIGGLRYYRSTDAVVQQSSQENTIVLADPGYPFAYPSFGVLVRCNEGMPTVKTAYVTTSQPDLTQVSNTATSLPAGYPALPAAPFNKWTGIIEPAYVFPALWVLEARPSQALHDEAGNQVCWAVEDLHVYYHPIRPNGG